MPNEKGSKGLSMNSNESKSTLEESGQSIAKEESRQLAKGLEDVVKNRGDGKVDRKDENNVPRNQPRLTGKGYELGKKNEYNDIASLSQAVLNLTEKIENMDTKLEASSQAISENLVKEMLKIIAEQQKSKSGRSLKEDYSNTDKNVPLKVNIPPRTLSELNKKVNSLRNSGQIKSRDMYLNQLLTKELGL